MAHRPPRRTAKVGAGSVPPVPVSSPRQPLPASSRQAQLQHRPQQAQHLMIGSLVGMVQAGRADLAAGDWTVA